MKKRVLAAVLATMMVATMMAGCGKSETKSEAKKDSYTIGIEQFAEHGSLDNCREGFLKGLEDEGIKEGKNLKVKYKNAAADMGTAGQISDCPRKAIQLSIPYDVPPPIALCNVIR